MWGLGTSDSEEGVRGKGEGLWIEAERKGQRNRESTQKNGGRTRDREVSVGSEPQRCALDPAQQDRKPSQHLWPSTARSLSDMDRETRTSKAMQEKEASCPRPAGRPLSGPPATAPGVEESLQGSKEIKRRRS